MYTRIKTDKEIDAMRHGGSILAAVLSRVGNNIEEEKSTKQLARETARELKALGGEPAFLGFQGFPEVICISINDEIVHGIPSEDKIVKKGDIVTLDLGVRYKGMIVDGAISVVCKPSSNREMDLVRYTREALSEGISVVKSGARVGDISSAIEKVLSSRKFGIVRDLVGHGVGHSLHEEPNIPNYGRKNTGEKLVAGMTLAIEPMATLGREAIITDSDGWTIRTRDGSKAAQFEHTVLVTESGCEILTQQ